MNNILLLGIDGFCGWPTALNLLSRGHSVFGIDNLSRRKIDLDLGLGCATPIATIHQRLKSVEEVFGKRVVFKNLDIAKDYSSLLDFIVENEIDTVVHLAEQKSAPYSMLGAKERRYTVDNNISSTNNVLSAIVDSGKDIHLVHLGTMGVYGYKDDFGKVPEGYLDIVVPSNQRNTKIPFPTDPGSIYHMTKSLDQILFQFYNKNWDLKITDLHQGIVWGIETEHTAIDERLVNRFDYDGEYGTALNRFVAQAAVNYPLTVYGSGGQERAYIHISDSVDCITRSIENRPSGDAVRIFNQVSEVKSINEIAEMISKKTGVPIKRIDNPRKEKSNNKLFVENTGLRDLGFEPKKISDLLINDILLLSEKYKNGIDISNILSKARW